MELIYFGD